MIEEEYIMARHLERRIWVCGEAENEAIIDILKK